MTDDELNAAVAREVMGWTDHYAHPETHWSSGYQKSESGADYWSPATDIAAAMNDVVGEMAKHKYDLSLSCIAGGRSHAAFTHEEAENGRAWASTPARAICEAALAAVRSEGCTST